jgi:acetyl-CoA C-acetyltransferase
MVAAQAIQCGDADIIVAGGMENMSMAPYYLENARWGQRMGDGKLKDHMLNDGLWDIVNDFHMGISNELVCEKWNVTRQEQDQFALKSYEKAISATQKGYFDDEIAPLTLSKRRGGTQIFKTDECVVATNMEILSGMKSAFKKDGVGTAGNASTLSDGAAAVLLMSEKKAAELGCTVMAEVGAQATACIEVKYILMAPIYGIPKVLQKEGISVNDVDLWEINEAFSGSSVAVGRELQIDQDRLNVNGGSVALGHPIGASGARVLTTLLYEMQRRDIKRGVASLCLGGGEAVAMVLNRG